MPDDTQWNDTKRVSEQLGVNRTLLYNWKSIHLEELEKAASPESASPKEMAEVTNSFEF